MAAPVSRIGDVGVGVCSAHITPVPINVIIVSGANTVPAVGSPVANIGSMGVCSCGHMSIAIVGSGTALAEGAGIHRIGDMGQPPAGSYVMTTGAPTVVAGG